MVYTLRMSLLPKLSASLGSFEPITPKYNQGSDSNFQVLGNLERFISTIIGVITVFAALYFIINFLMGAIGWISAGGDSGKISSARDRMVHGVIGLIIVVAAYGIIGLIGAIVGIEILNPAAMLSKAVPHSPPSIP